MDDENNSKLLSEIICLKKKLGQYKEENDEIKQDNPMQSADSTAILKASKRAIEGESGDLAKGIDAKKSKLSIKIVPNWLIDVIAWIKRIEMANSALASSSQTFKLLCWPKLHGNVKPHKMPELEFFKGHESGNVRALLRTPKNGFFWFNKKEYIYIPIASIPPPNYIIGVERIELRFLDDHILDFFKNIAQLIQNCTFKFDSNILKFEFESIRNRLKKDDEKFIKIMSGIMECLAGKIFVFDFECVQNWRNFCTFFPGISDHVQMLSISREARDFSISAEPLDFAFIANWLTKPRSDGKQKLIRLANYFSQNLYADALVNRIKEDFVNSILPSKFCLQIHTENSAEFVIENAQTNEILSFQRNIFFSFYDLARYPKGEEHWKKEGELKIYSSVIVLPDYMQITISYEKEDGE